MNHYHCYYLDGPRANNLVSFESDPLRAPQDGSLISKLCSLGTHDAPWGRHLSTYKVFRCHHKGKWFLLASVREKLNNVELSLRIALKAGLKPHCILQHEEFSVLFEAGLPDVKFSVRSFGEARP